MSKINARRSLLRSTALVGSLCFALWSAAAVAQAQTYSFDIPAEPLSSALREFARVSGQQIIFTDDLVAGRSAAPLHGSYSADDALSRLLAGTALVVDRSSSGAIMVRLKNAQAASNEGVANSNSIETVTVTGTHLRDTETLTPVTTITSSDLTRQGYSTLSEALAQMPQNSGAGVTASSNANTGIGEGATNNYSFASGVNLRGLGPNDTLVLLNGRRLPPTALGSTIDISGIPVGAIDRVEILDDGASAIYGADAVAGVVNIITKTNYDGVETGARMYSIANGKQPNYSGYALAGDDWGSGSVLFNYDYQKENTLLASERSYSSSAFDPTFLLPKQETSSFYGSVNQQISSRLRFSADGIFSSRSFAEDNQESFYFDADTGRAKQFAGSAELDYAAFGDWNVSLVGQLGRENDNQNAAYTVLDYTSKNSYRYGVNSIELQGDGTLFSLPGGDARLAVGASERHESFDQVSDHCDTGSPCDAPLTTHSGNNVFSAYGEVLLPIV